MGNCCGRRRRRAAPTGPPRELPSAVAARSALNLDPANFKVSKVAGQTVVRRPGTIAGQQFIIEECEGCDIYVCDYSAAITVDDCRNCRIFIGPCEGSVFVRTSTNCTVMAACQQFRGTDLDEVTLFLHCPTPPSVESCKNLHFGCFQANYPGLQENFASARLNIFNNEWASIHDFNAKRGEETSKCYTLLDGTSSPSGPGRFNLEGPEVAEIGLTMGDRNSIIPPTWGRKDQWPPHPVTFVAFFGDYEQEALRFICDFLQKHPGFLLLQSKNVKLSFIRADRVWGQVKKQCSAIVTASTKGHTTGFQISGDGVLEAANRYLDAFVRTVETAGKENKVVAYASPSPGYAADEAGQFFERESDAYQGSALAGQ